MTLSELIYALQQEQEYCEGDPEVYLAHQPDWPLAFTVAGVVAQADLDSEIGPDEDPDDGHHGRENVVWIVEGHHPSDDPYAPKSAWDNL